MGDGSGRKRSMVQQLNQMLVVGAPTADEAATVKATATLTDVRTRREPLGSRARRLFVELNFTHTHRDPCHKLAHLPGAGFPIDLFRLLVWWWQTSGHVARDVGVSRLRQ